MRTRDPAFASRHHSCARQLHLIQQFLTLTPFLVGSARVGPTRDIRAAAAGRCGSDTGGSAIWLADNQEGGLPLAFDGPCRGPPTAAGLQPHPTPLTAGHRCPACTPVVRGVRRASTEAAASPKESGGPPPNHCCGSQGNSPTTTQNQRWREKNHQMCGGPRITVKAAGQRACATTSAALVLSSGMHCHHQPTASSRLACAPNMCPTSVFLWGEEQLLGHPSIVTAAARVLPRPGRLPLDRGLACRLGGAPPCKPHSHGRSPPPSEPVVGEMWGGGGAGNSRTRGHVA